MKKFSGLLILAFLIFNNFLSAQNSQNEQKTGDLTVVINGFKNSNGSVQIALYNSEKSYNNEQEDVFRTKTIAVEKKGVTWIFRNIAFGDYAVKTFHDENEDRLINKNHFGFPLEKYGFSNNAKGRFGPPAFAKAVFRFNAESAVVEIKLK